MKKILPWYIDKMYYYLRAMSDDDLDKFHINEEIYLAKLFDEMKRDFDTYGPVSKQRVLEAIEYIYSSGEPEKYWDWMVPGEVPVDEVEDKPGFIRALYKKLSGHEISVRDFGPDVELVMSPGPHGVDVRE